MILITTNYVPFHRGFSAYDYYKAIETKRTPNIEIEIEIRKNQLIKDQF